MRLSGKTCIRFFARRIWCSNCQGSGHRGLAASGWMKRLRSSWQGRTAQGQKDLAIRPTL